MYLQINKEQQIKAAWDATWKYLCSRGSRGSVILFNAVSELYRNLISDIFTKFDA